MTDALARIWRVADSLERSLAIQVGPHQPLKTSGRKPQLGVPPISWFLEFQEGFGISNELRKQMLGVTLQRLQSTKEQVLLDFDKSLPTYPSLEHLSHISDEAIESHVCEVFETRWGTFMDRIRITVSTALIQYRTAAQAEQKKGHGHGEASPHLLDLPAYAHFHQHANTVLELAFQESKTLTVKETSIVAQAAGITHQQVRTWFQNRRNRKSKGRRTASISALQQRVSEDVAPPTRRVHSLPKRAQQAVQSTSTSSSSTSPDTLHPPGRTIRGLPRRKLPSPEVPSPSSNSTISLDSIPPSGGFTSPFDHVHHTAPTISFGKTIAPSLGIIPPTPQHPWFNCQMTAESPMELGMEMPSWDMGLPWNGEEFSEAIQQVLDNPTLGGSPSFTSSGSEAYDSKPASPPAELVDLGLGGIADMTQDELFALLGEMMATNRSFTNHTEGLEGIETMDELVDSVNFEDLNFGLTFSSSASGSSTPSIFETISTVETQSSIVQQQPLTDNDQHSVSDQDLHINLTQPAEASSSYFQYIGEPCPDALAGQNVEPLQVAPMTQVPPQVMSREQMYPSFSLYPAPLVPQIHQPASYDYHQQYSTPYEPQYVQGASWIPDVLPFEGVELRHQAFNTWGQPDMSMGCGVDARVSEMAMDGQMEQSMGWVQQQM